jgi:hypothetical protein
MKTKNEIFSRYLGEYIKSTVERKGEILTIVSDATQMHRKAAIRKFKRLQLKGVPLYENRGRKATFTPDSIAALKVIWEAASEICGELLHPIIKEYVDVLQRDRLWQNTPDATDKLLCMSEATVKRKVGSFMKARRASKGLSATKPSNLKEIIPIFTGPWEVKPPGYGQVDTVVHCGSSLLGNMAFTVNYTDVSLLWVSFSAQWNKGQQETRNSLMRIKGKVPFKIFGMHPDTGSEFVNWFLKGWCEQNDIELTRSRPNHKNDNAYVEQKNGHVIRRFLGYTRIDCQRAIAVMNRMYDKLEMYLNHFVPSRKCVEKIRIGSRYKRKYDKSKTAYQRVLNHPKIEQSVKDRLIAEHEVLNPLLLKQEIDKLISEIFNIQRLHGNNNSDRKSF